MVPHGDGLLSAITHLQRFSEAGATGILRQE
jgi:hypothetical protein